MIIIKGEIFWCHIRPIPQLWLPYYCYVEKHTFPYCSCTYYFGVTLDQFLNFDYHITAIWKSTHFHIIHALISCRLHYSNSILYNVPKTKTDRLQRIQNQCARILTKSPHREHINPVLKNLHWLKIQDRIAYEMLMLTYKSSYILHIHLMWFD